MFGLSGEHLLILAGVLLIFGPRKLPELGASVGRALRNFKEGLNSPPSSGKLEARDAATVEVKPAPETVTASGTPNPSTQNTSTTPPTV